MKKTLLSPLSLAAYSLLTCFIIIYAGCDKQDIDVESKEAKMSSRNNAGNAPPPDTFIYVPVVFGYDLNVLLEDTTPFNGAYLTKVRRESMRVNPLRYQLGRFDIDVADTIPFRAGDSFAIVRVIKI